MRTTMTKVSVQTHCNTLQHTATHCYTRQHTAIHCTLQHTATHCNTLQHTTWYNHVFAVVVGNSVLQCVAVCCCARWRYCVALCYSVLQCVAVTTMTKVSLLSSLSLSLSCALSFSFFRWRGRRLFCGVQWRQWRWWPKSARTRVLSLYFARTRALSLSALSFVQCHNRLSQKLSKYQDTDSENARTSILKKKSEKGQSIC